MFCIVDNVVQKILWKFLEKILLILQDLKFLVYKFPYAVRQVDMVHKIHQKGFPYLQRSIQLLAQGIRERLFPLFLITPGHNILVNLIDPVHPQIDLGLFFLLILLRTPGQIDRSLIGLSEPLKSIRVIFRIHGP